MTFRHVSGLQADQQRRILKDLQRAKRHKGLQGLHEYRDKRERVQMLCPESKSCVELMAT